MNNNQKTQMVGSQSRSRARKLDSRKVISALTEHHPVPCCYLIYYHGVYA